MELGQVFDAMQVAAHLFPKGIGVELAEVYAEYFSGKCDLGQFKAALKVAIIQGKINPSPEWLMQAVAPPLENRESYRVVSGNTSLLLRQAPEQPSLSEDDSARGKTQRTVILAAIYKHQGDTPFYRRLLSGEGGLYGRILAATAGSFTVSHQDVLDYLGISPSNESLTSASNFDQEGGSGITSDEIAVRQNQAPSRAKNGPVELQATSEPAPSAPNFDQQGGSDRVGGLLQPVSVAAALEGEDDEWEEF